MVSLRITLILEALDQRIMQDLGWMLCDSSGSIFDLVPATSARCGDNRLWRGGSNRRQEDELADFHGDVEMFLFVAERTGHSAAS